MSPRSSRFLIRSTLAVLTLAGTVACEDSPTGVVTMTPSAAITNALEAAIQDEYKAESTYLRVLGDFGPVLPFQNIAFAEERHSLALSWLFLQRDMTVPLSEWTLENVPRFDSVADACAASALAEIENIELYDEFLAMDLPQDVRTVFENNREASLTRHLPAFERCS